MKRHGAMTSSRNSSIAIGAGLGMIFGAALGNAAVGLVLGAAVGAALKLRSRPG